MPRQAPTRRRPPAGPDPVARQLHFDLPPRVRLGEGDFFVADANERAWEMVLGAVPWPARKLALIGAEGAGKSHLAGLWADGAGAAVLTAQDRVVPEDLPAAVLVEDVDRLPRSGEEALFHLHNRLVQSEGRLLLTGRSAPGRWDIALPDLRSRLETITAVRIEDPDETLLSVLLAKLFADRQLTPAPDVIPYLAARMERSYAAARDLVAALDHAALSQGRDITRPLAREVMDSFPDGAR